MISCCSTSLRGYRRHLQPGFDKLSKQKNWGLPSVAWTLSEGRFNGSIVSKITSATNVQVARKLSKANWGQDTALLHGSLMAVKAWTQALINPQLCLAPLMQLSSKTQAHTTDVPDCGFSSM